MSYSGLSRVSMDPRNKSEDDCSEYISEDDKRECVLEDDFTLKSSLRAGRRGQAICEIIMKYKTIIQISLRSLYQVFTLGKIYDIVLVRGKVYNWSYKMRKNDLNQSSLLSYSGKFSSMSYSGLSRVSMDPRNKSEDDCYKKNESEDDKRECVLEDDCYKKMSPSMTMMMWILVSSLTMTGTVYAECTPAPDCVELGYTETSCNGGFVRCPFDINKLLCIPCDSSYKYACSETGEIGSGTACNGKYIECECTDGYELVDGACVVSCAYTLTALPTGCSATDSCVKNGTTYYSSTCTTCKSGYTISSGTCKANTCSGYSSSIPSQCATYSTCKSGTATKYKCTACESGYKMISQAVVCIDEACYESYKNASVKNTHIISGGTGCTGVVCTGNNGITYCIGSIEI